MIMLVTSALASGTSSFIEAYSVSSKWEAILHANPAVHDKLPDPTQGPAKPISDTTPEAGAGSSFSTNTSPGESSRFNIIVNTSCVAVRMAWTSSDCAMSVTSCSAGMLLLLGSGLNQSGQFLLDLLGSERLLSI